MITLRGRRLRNEVLIPSNIWRLEATKVPISLEAPDLSINISLPRWNTHALHAPSLGTEIGRIGLLRLNSSYRYFSDVQEDHVEQLKMDIMARTFSSCLVIQGHSDHDYHNRCATSHSRHLAGLYDSSWLCATTT